MKRNKESSFKIAVFSLIAMIVLFTLLSIQNCVGQVVVSRAYWANDSTVVVNTESHYELNVPKKEPLVLVDTITTMRPVDVDGNYVKLGGIDITGETHYAYIKFEGYGMIKYETDSVNNWEGVYKFKRVRHIGGIEYVKLGIVPQIRSIRFTNFTNTSVRLDIAYTHKISKVECYVDGNLYKKFSPGHYEIEDLEDYNYTQYWGITGLKKGVDYEVLIFVTFVSGDVDTSEAITLRL